MPQNPEPEGSPRLLTIDQIAEKHGVSRSSVHTYRRGGTFPRPVPVEGTTRVLFDADEVAAWFEANPKQQGRRTDLPAKQQQGDPAVTEEQHGGVGRDDDGAREHLLNTAVLIEERWPGEHPILCRDLRDLADTIGEEASDG